MPRLISGDIRSKIVPADDLSLQGDTGEPLKLHTDVDIALALLSLANAIRPRLAQAGNNGGLLVTDQPDANGVIGSQGNVWNNVATGVAANGNIIDTLNAPFITLLVTVNGACTITVMESADGVNFIAGPTNVFAGAGSFIFQLTAGARFITMQSTANVVATGTVQAKAA